MNLMPATSLLKKKFVNVSDFFFYNLVIVLMKKKFL